MPVKRQDVVLHKYIDGEVDENARLHTVTDSRGHFRFTKLPIGKGFAYYPTTVFAGIEYDGDLVFFTADTLHRNGDIMVYQTSRLDSGITVPMQHVMVRPGAGVLEIKEIAIFANRRPFTYIGKELSGQTGMNSVLEIDLPENAREVTVGGDLMRCCAVFSGNRVIDTMDFKPGMRREVVSYLLPFHSGTATLRKTLTQPTDLVDVFIPEKTATLASNDFVERGSFQIGRETYIRYSASAYKKGDALRLTFQNLTPAPHDWRWLPPVVLILLISSGLVLYRFRGKLAGVTAEERATSVGFGEEDSRRRQLLKEILKLEQAYEMGQIDENLYFERRKKQIKRLEETEQKGKIEPFEN